MLLFLIRTSLSLSSRSSVSFKVLLLPALTWARAVTVITTASTVPWLCFNLSFRSTQILTSPYRTSPTECSSPNPLLLLVPASPSETSSSTSPKSLPLVSSTALSSKTPIASSRYFTYVWVQVGNVFFFFWGFQCTFLNSKTQNEEGRICCFESRSTFEFIYLLSKHALTNLGNFKAKK